MDSTPTFISITISVGTRSEMRNMCSRHWRHSLPAASVNECRRHVQPNYGALRNTCEVIWQQIRKFFRASQSQSMEVRKSDEPSARLQHAHHFMQKLSLHGFRKHGPRQSRNNAIHRLHSCLVADASYIGHAVPK